MVEDVLQASPPVPFLPVNRLLRHLVPSVGCGVVALEHGLSRRGIADVAVDPRTIVRLRATVWLHVWLLRKHFLERGVQPTRRRAVAHDDVSFRGKA